MSATLKRYGIVVGVDGSDVSNAAVVWAACDAAMRNVPLTLVHMFKEFVPTFPQIPMPIGVAEWQEDVGRKVLVQAVKIAENAVPSDRTIAMTSEVRCSPPVPTLVEMSTEAEMVVGLHRARRGRPVVAGFGEFGRGAQREVSGGGDSCRGIVPAAFQSSPRAGGHRCLAGLGACAGHCIRRGVAS